MALAELEAALVADPEDAATYAVYVDALVAAGDARGELGAIQQRRAEADSPELAAAEGEVLERRGEELLGKALSGASTQVRAGFDLTWRCGHVRSLVVHEPYNARPTAGEVLRDLLARPAARLVTSFALEHRDGVIGQLTADSFSDEYRRGPQAIEALAATPRPALRALAFGQRDIPFDIGGEDDGRAAVSQAAGNLSGLGKLWRATPNLRELLISGGGYGLGELVLRELRSLEIRQASMSRNDIEQIRKGDLPKLESLVLWLGGGDYGERDYDLAKLCDPAKFPALRHLGLVCCADTPIFVGMLSRSPILAQLRTLDLRGGTLSEYRELATPAFAHLETIDLRWNSLPPGGPANTLVSNQREWSDVPRFNACQE
jgi:hypothetical protein